MDADFWHRKWANNDTGFHEQLVNALLEKNFQRLALPRGSRIFLPLCGKTRDIAWLLDAGYRVVGAELSELAVMQLFNELGAVPVIATEDSFKRYSAPNLDIFVGDIFDLSAAALGSVDAVYDRAALIALPVAMRARYARHLLAITQAAPQLLICLEYDQRELAGPPFSVDAEEVQKHYGGTYAVVHIAQRDVAGGLKGKCPAVEAMWMLKRR